jgi:hypothetical protein
MKRIITSLLLLISSLVIHAQEKPEVVTHAMETKNYVFTAQSVTPQRGRMRQLTTTYDLVVRPDTIIAALPYFGRAYSAPIGDSDGGIDFTSTDFEYAEKMGKKNRREITIKPKGITDVRELYLEVFDNGRASLRVSSNNRESISYDGYVKEGKPLD